MLVDYLRHKNILILGVFYVIITYHSRLIELISRLDFLWKLQAQKELQDMRELRHYNTQLLRNILPDHVANYFLAHDNRLGGKLYAQSYSCVGVLFASIPNFASFYSEEVNNGMECIRLLNEIIFDFDQLLDEDRFRSIEKIKTISSTYMAACGLNPKDQHKQANDHLCALTEFALAMRSRLQELNVHSFNNFQLRVGLSVGALVGGVIGAKKPVFDVWGDTVNEASRMESTGRLDAIQISKVGADVLATEGYPVQRRGVIHVKGKGNMETYFVYGKNSSPQTDWTAAPEVNANTNVPMTTSSTSVGTGNASAVSMTDKSGSSLAEVMFNMVQVRKKQTLAGSLSVPSAASAAASQSKGSGKHARINFSLRTSQDDDMSTGSGVSSAGETGAFLAINALDRNRLTNSSTRSGFRLQRIKSEKPANRKSGQKRKYLSKIRLSDGFAEFNSSNFRGNLLDFARHRNVNSSIVTSKQSINASSPGNHATINMNTSNNGTNSTNITNSTTTTTTTTTNNNNNTNSNSNSNSNNNSNNNSNSNIIHTSGTNNSINSNDNHNAINDAGQMITSGTKNCVASDAANVQLTSQTTSDQLIEMRNCRSVSPSASSSSRFMRKRDKQIDYL